MTKPKLTDAVKPTSEKLPETAQPAASAGATGTGGTPEISPAASTEGDEGESEESEEAPEPTEKQAEQPAASQPVTNPALAQYTSAFGETQGCVFFANGVSFADACTQHMASQAATITAQAAEIAALKKTGIDLASKLKGEDEPLATGPQGTKAPATGDAAVSDFAKSVGARLAK